MYECVQAGENTFFMDCPSRVGVYRDGEEPQPEPCVEIKKEK